MHASIIPRAITAKSGLFCTVLILLTSVSALGIAWKTGFVLYHAWYIYKITMYIYISFVHNEYH